MAYTTLYLSGRDLCDEAMLVRTDLADPTSPIEVNHCDGEGWQLSGHQSAVAMGQRGKLQQIALLLAAEACGLDEEFHCDCRDAEEELSWERLCQFGVVGGELQRIGTAIDGDEYMAGDSTVDAARQWLRAGFAAADVRAWAEIGCWTADDAAVWRDHGLTPEDVRAAAQSLREEYDTERYSESLVYHVCNGDLSADRIIARHGELQAAQ